MLGNLCKIEVFFVFSETMETCISGEFGFFLLSFANFSGFIDCSPILYIFEMHFNLFYTNLEMISIFWREMEKFCKYFWYVALFVHQPVILQLFAQKDNVRKFPLPYVNQRLNHARLLCPIKKNRQTVKMSTIAQPTKPLIIW
jgi:hypothetical protein